MSQTRVKREVNHGPGSSRSVWPRAPHHGKHTNIQGFANTRSLTDNSTRKKKK